MMKRLFALILTLALLAGMAPAALASTGDVTIYHANYEEGMGFYSVENCMLAGSQVYYYAGSKLYVYDITTQETAEYDAQSIMEMVMDTSDGEPESEEEILSEEDATATYTEIVSWFIHDGDIYAVANVSTDTGTSRTIDGGHVKRLALSEGKATLEDCDIPQLDWSGMTEEYGDYVYSRWAQNAFCSGDNLFIQTSDDEGNGVVQQFDLTTGQAKEHYIQDLNSMAPAGDGRLLICQYAWGDEAAHLGFYDPDSESIEERADYPVDTASYNMPQSLCFRQADDTLYYVSSGEIWAAPGFDFEAAQAVNDCPVSGGSDRAGQMTDDGFMLIYDYDTIVLRNTDPAARSEITLYVKDYSYNDAIERAYYDFTNRHGDISMVISRSGQPGDILQAMMNRDGSCDIYAMDMALSQYSAVFERGFMAELDGSEKLTSQVNSMYPAIAEALKKDGALYAIPLNAYGYTLGVRPAALEKLGLTMDDMPRTWDGFFDFLNELPALLEGKDVRAFDSWFEQRDLRMQLFSIILMSYQNYINAGEAEYAFNTPLLNGLLDRLYEIDMEGLEVNETNYDEETDTWYGDYDNREVLFTDSASTVMQSYSEGSEALLLSFGEEEPIAAFNLRVAFVNPFSSHVAESIEYLETVIDSLNQQSQYTFYPDCDEPLRYPDYEEYKQNLAKWLEEAKAALEKADEDEKEDYEQSVKSLQEDLDNIDDTYWMFSPKAIESYKARAPYLKPVTYDFTNEITDEDENFYSLIQRFYEGDLTVSELLAAIDKKVQMMRLEGM